MGGNGEAGWPFLIGLGWITLRRGGGGGEGVVYGKLDGRCEMRDKILIEERPLGLLMHTYIHYIIYIHIHTRCRPPSHAKKEKIHRQYCSSVVVTPISIVASALFSIGASASPLPFSYTRPFASFPPEIPVVTAGDGNATPGPAAAATTTTEESPLYCNSTSLEERRSRSSRPMRRVRREELLVLVFVFALSECTLM